MTRFFTIVKNLTHLLEIVKKNALFALVILIFRGLTEGIGLLFIVPLLSITGVSNLEESNSPLVQFIHQTFESTGFSISITSVLVIYFIIMCLYAILNYVQKVITVKINQGVVLKWRNLFFERITYASWPSIQQTKGSDLQAILTTDIRRFSAISNQTIQFVGTAILIIIYMTLSFFLSFQLSILSILPVALLILLNKPINRKTYELGEATVKHNKGMQSVILEHLSALKLVKSFQKEKEHISTFQKTSTLTEKQNVLFAKTSGITKLIFEIIAALVIVVYIFIALDILDIPITEVLLLIFIFARLLPKVSKLVNGYQQILNNLPSFETTLETFDLLDKEKRNNIGKPIGAIERGIKLKEVSFAYAEKQVLSDLNILIEANKTTLILGASGAGKSTLIDLIIGIQPPTNGRISIDDTPLEFIDKQDWRSKIAFVPQDAFLFYDSILENLLWAKIGATTKEIETALHQAGAFDFVQNLPNGINTIVGDRGTELSGGERQRIALARALLRKPQLLILDEATNAVDDKNEELIKNALAKLSGQLTIIIIAHRSTLVKLADHTIQL